MLRRFALSNVQDGFLRHYLIVTVDTDAEMEQELSSMSVEHWLTSLGMSGAAAEELGKTKTFVPTNLWSLSRKEARDAFFSLVCAIRPVQRINDVPLDPRNRVMYVEIPREAPPSLMRNISGETLTRALRSARLKDKIFQFRPDGLSRLELETLFLWSRIYPLKNAVTYLGHYNRRLLQPEFHVTECDEYEIRDRNLKTDEEIYAAPFDRRPDKQDAERVKERAHTLPVGVFWVSSLKHSFHPSSRLEYFRPMTSVLYFDTQNDFRMLRLGPCRVSQESTAQGNSRNSIPAGDVPYNPLDAVLDYAYLGVLTKRRASTSSAFLNPGTIILLNNQERFHFLGTGVLGEPYDKGSPLSDWCFSVLTTLGSLNRPWVGRQLCFTAAVRLWLTPVWAVPESPYWEGFRNVGAHTYDPAVEVTDLRVRLFYIDAPDLRASYPLQLLASPKMTDGFAGGMNFPRWLQWTSVNPSGTVNPDDVAAALC